MKNTVIRNKSGFTLLEIIIVIIIIGVLASLALPKFIAQARFVRGAEAAANLGAYRQSLNRCYMFNGGAYNAPTLCSTLTNLDIGNLGDAGINPGTHFTYNIPAFAAGVTAYTITATRNANQNPGGVEDGTLTMNSNGVITGASGVYLGRAFQ